MSYPNGLLGYVTEDCENTPEVKIEYYESLYTDQVIVFLDPMSGLKQAGPVSVVTYEDYGRRLKVNCSISVKKGTAIYISGSQDELNPPVIKREK
jgi:hypothetical protein